MAQGRNWADSAPLCSSPPTGNLLRSSQSRPDTGRITVNLVHSRELLQTPRSWYEETRAGNTENRASATARLDPAPAQLGQAQADPLSLMPYAASIPGSVPLLFARLASLAEIASPGGQTPSPASVAQTFSRQQPCARHFCPAGQSALVVQTVAPKQSPPTKQNELPSGSSPQAQVCSSKQGTGL
ncbi:hypothetical protein P170DRAFT_437513 [Aspergillus steynii IBT 23096]|uniref:Uncharacterized protein n=1 Tax=Aspergillus steynii IBT 23096 TaxID=1392250 RepID=A0A2I2G4H1_9EURO|nr:uncharacterized protein P170DRAFT_437513 [Aspergillus steynii IBT 23096]PLB47774.1 hypothetical protein P170DRAFT_437513 [Aspergillus steynii IBT 23096]